MADELKPLQELMESLSPRELRKGIKKGMRQVAKEGQRIVGGYLDREGVVVRGNKSDWKRAIRSYVYSRGGGLLISVKPHGKKGFHKNRDYGRTGREMPILMWLESGVEDRWTAGRRSSMRRGHSTGTIHGLGFMDKAEGEVSAFAERELGKAINVELDKIASK